MKGRNIESTHESARMVAFSDGVVAIGITLLILPLAAVELPPDDAEALTHPLIYVWNTYNALIVSSLISWFSILVFWLAHHRIFGGISQINGRILIFNAIWLFAVVVIPFPTNLLDQTQFLAEDDGPSGVASFYVGTMFVMSLMLALIVSEVRRDHSLLNERGRKSQMLTQPVWAAYSITGYLFVVLLASLVVGTDAMWGLFGLAVIDPITDWLLSRRDQPQPST